MWRCKFCGCTKFEIEKKSMIKILTVKKIH